MEQLEDRCVPSTLQAISVPQGSQPPSDTAAGPSYLPAVSADGKFVAFESTATNLVPGQTGGASENVFLLDRVAGTVTLVSHLPGAPTEGLFNSNSSGPPLISRDGRYVVYSTNDDAVVGQPGSFDPVVVVYDRTTGLNTLVGHGTTLPLGAASASLYAISGDGRYVAFGSSDPDVVPNEVTNPSIRNLNLYEYDQVTGTTRLITHAPGQPAVEAGGDASAVSVADDGTVAFEGFGDLVSGVTNVSFDDVYLYSPATQANQLISTVRGSPTVAAGSSSSPVISGDGSTVVFVSSAGDLVANQASNAFFNVFRYSRATGAVSLVSGADGSPSAGGNADSGRLSGVDPLDVSHDGRFIAFASQATNLVPGQTGAPGNVFLYDAQTATLTLVSGAGGSPTAGAGGDATLQPFGSGAEVFTPRLLSVSADGSALAFASSAGNLAPGQTGPAGTENVFLYDRATGQVSLASGAAGSATAAANASSGGPSLNGNGQVLAFFSLATNLVNGVRDGNGLADVFTYSPGGEGPGLVSRAAFPQLVSDNSYSASVSADGRYTVFTSTAQDLVPNQVTDNTNQNIFLYDRQAGAVTLVNHVPGLPNKTGDEGIPFTSGQRPLSFQVPVISADGSTVAFTSSDDDLVPGETPDNAIVPGVPFGVERPYEPLVYLYNVQTGQVRLVNHAPGNPATPAGVAQQPVLSADGRYVALREGDPVDGAGPILGSLVLYDSVQDTTPFLIADNYPSQAGIGLDPAISDDGRYVAYQNADQVFMSQTNTFVARQDVYVFDSHAASNTIVSHNFAAPGTAANGDSTAPVLSHDGSTVAFVSAATDLVSGQASSPLTNVFAYDVTTGAVRLVSGANGSAAVGGDGDSDSPAVAGDGSSIAYRSSATDLIGGQSATGSNVYEFNTSSGTQTLVSHQAGSPALPAGGVPEPAPFGPPVVVLDDDGHLVSYVSTAGDLIPGQSGMAGVSNVFVWLRQTGANILASGQGGSPTVTGNADSDGPLLTRDSFPGFSSVATNLVNGVGGRSVAYINTLVAVALSPNTVTVGSPAGTTVGSLSVSSLLAGQFLPPVYSLPGAEANNALFGLSGAALLTEFAAAAAAGYQVRLHVNVGFGDSPVLLSVFAAVPAPGGGFVGGPPVGGAHPLMAELVSVRVGKGKTRRLMIEVFDLVTGAEVEAFASPFQSPAYRAITLTPLGNGLFRLSAREGKRSVTALLPA